MTQRVFAWLDERLGILLLLYYRPSAGEAYESVQFIVSQVQFGWLIRNLHAWSGSPSI